MALTSKLVKVGQSWSNEVKSHLGRLKDMEKVDTKSDCSYEMRSSRQGLKPKCQRRRVPIRVRGLLEKAKKVRQNSNWVKRSIILYAKGMQKMISNGFTS